jgi:hypothetical protein
LWLKLLAIVSVNLILIAAAGINDASIGGVGELCGY